MPTDDEADNLGRKRKWLSAGPVDRLPPHDLESEVGLLGCILLSPVECLPEVVEKVKDAGICYDLRHKTILETLIEMHGESVGIDIITLQSWLKSKALLDSVGGLPYIAALPDGVPSAANLSYYIDILKEKHAQRKIIQTCGDAVSRLFDGAEAKEVLCDLDRASQELTSGARRTTPTIREAVQSAINRIEAIHQNQGEVSGLSCGYPDIDKMTGGFQSAEMILIAGRTSAGKTSLAMNMAEHVALDQELPVGIFSLEMDIEPLVMRMICSRARVNLRNLRDGFLSESDFPKIVGAAGKISSAPIYIDDRGGLTILEIRSKARQWQQLYGIKLLVLDYLQLVQATARRNRQEEVSEISSGLKKLAKELGIPVIVLSQLNREIDKEKNRKPRLSDLRESGSQEQDCDLAFLLYRATRADDDSDVSAHSDSVAVNALLAKNRNGPTGDIPLTFMKVYTRFESAARVNSGDVPYLPTQTQQEWPETKQPYPD